MQSNGVSKSHEGNSGGISGNTIARAKDDALSEHAIVVADATAPGATLVSELVNVGFAVHRTLDAASTLLEVAAHRPKTVLLELRVGRSSGLDLIRQIRSLSSGTRCIVVTMYGSIESVRATMAGGAVDYFTKPVSVHEIVRAISGNQEQHVDLDHEPWMGVQTVRRRYIEAALAQYGSVAQASRALRVDRRSLRRMLRR